MPSRSMSMEAVTTVAPFAGERRPDAGRHDTARLDAGRPGTARPETARADTGRVGAGPGGVALIDAPLIHAPLIDAPLDESRAGDFASMFKALGDPVRLRLLSLIASAADGEICVCDLSGEFPLTGPTISHHLRILREAGLVDSDRRGTWVYYRPVPGTFTLLASLLRVTS